MTTVRGASGDGHDRAEDGPELEEDEEREAAQREAWLSGSGAGAEGGIVVPWPVLFRHRMHGRVAASDRYQWWVLWTVLAGLLSVNITFTVFVVALPQVAHELHTSVSTLTWTSTGPLLAFGVAAPILGKLGDLRGYRRLYLMGLAGAAVSVMLTASAPTAGVLIAARLFDGVQGAATGAASMALMLQVFSHEDRVKAMGWWALVGAGGPVLGVTIGAPIIQYLGWRALFWGELPLMAAAALLAVIVLPADPHRRRSADGASREGPKRRLWSELDWLGSLTLSASVTAGLLALNQAPSWGFGDTRTLGLFCASGLFVVAFVWHEGRTDKPLIPLRYFRLRNFVFPVGARASVNFAYMGGFFLFPILMERVYGYSETAAGLVSTARPLCFSIVAPIAGYAAVRVGERASVVAGAISLTASMVIFTQLGADPSLTVIVAALALSGVANGLATPSSTSSAANEFDPSELGVMSAAQQLIAQIGIVAGIQVMVTVQASPGGGAGDLADFHRAFAVGAAVAALSGVFGLFIRNTPRARRARAADAEEAPAEVVAG
ncbi:MAG: MFS transporter [Acidimicrobiales bacterium]|nr:MFS transporter [Acidimicrobiales bacterium]